MFVGHDGVAVANFLEAVAVSLAICVGASPLGGFLGVLSHPDEARRRHETATPQVGGIAILTGLLFWILASLLTNQGTDRAFLYAVALCAAGVGAVGFADDQKGVSPLARIILLVAFVWAAFAIDPEFVARALNWGSWVPTPIPAWLYLTLMAVATVGVVNAVNMADGQDGIVGGMYVIWSACLMLVTHGTSAVVAGLLCATSAVFLFFNLWGRMFLGNCGSYGVAFVIGLLVTLAHARGQVSLETVIVWFFVPVADCVRLLISRPLRGVSPFEGDRDHFHHRLQDIVGKRMGLVYYVGAVATTSAIATASPRFALVCLCALCAFYFSFAWLGDAKAAAADNAKPEEPDRDTSNVVPLSGEGIRGQRQLGTP